MTQKSLSIYRLADGAFTGMRVQGDEAFVNANIPLDHGGVEGLHDHLSYRVDLATGTVVDWQPPAPSADHEWDGAKRRWVLGADADARRVLDIVARDAIAALEAAQHRAVREHLLGDAAALARIKDIDDRIAELRKELQ